MSPNVCFQSLGLGSCFAHHDLCDVLAQSSSSSFLQVMEFDSWLNKWFLLVFLMSCMMGFVLNYSIILCTAYNSALTTTIVGVLKVGQSVCLCPFYALPTTPPWLPPLWALSQLVSQSVCPSVSTLCAICNWALTTTIVGVLKVGQLVRVSVCLCLYCVPQVCNWAL